MGGHRATASSTTSPDISVSSTNADWLDPNGDRKDQEGACSCSSNTVVGEGSSGGVMVGNRMGAQAELQIRLDDWSGEKSSRLTPKTSSSTTIYGKACEFDEVADLEEQKVAEQTPPDQLGSEASRFNLELQPNAPLICWAHSTSPDLVDCFYLLSPITGPP